jgi:hypothetical protein
MNDTVNRPTGLSLIAVDDLPGGRIYLCDSESHMVNVLDESGYPLFSFGGYGQEAGQLDTPVDVAILSIDGSEIQSAIDAVVAVAERGNHRVQFFELDGAPLGTVEHKQRHGFWLPSRLEWERRQLRVASSSGETVLLDVASALLTQIGWQHEASAMEAIA